MSLPQKRLIEELGFLNYVQEKVICHTEAVRDVLSSVPDSGAVPSCRADGLPGSKVLLAAFGFEPIWV